MSTVTVFGAGAWGSTMAQVLSDAGNDVLLWGRSKDVIAEINSVHTNKKYLGAHELPHSLRATTDLAQAFAHSHIYVLAIPAQQLRLTLQEWKPFFTTDSIIVSTLKGIEISTQMRMTEVIEDVLGPRAVAIITGPNLADELVLRQPAGAVAAAGAVCGAAHRPAPLAHAAAPPRPDARALGAWSAGGPCARRGHGRARRRRPARARSSGGVGAARRGRHPGCRAQREPLHPGAPHRRRSRGAVTR